MSKPHNESKDLEHAISLAYRMIRHGDACTIADNAGNHAAEIAKYDPQHSSIKVLNNLMDDAKDFLLKCRLNSKVLK